MNKEVNINCSRSITIDMTADNYLLTFSPDSSGLKPNSFGLKDIMNNASLTLDFKLLAIEENISPDHQSSCIYDPCKENFSCCNISETEYAHLYISTNTLNQHCIILFANKTLSKISDINGLVDKFFSSFERFKKQDADFPNSIIFKPLRFYIYFYGVDPPVGLGDYNKYCAYFTRALEQRLGYRKNELDGCVFPNTIKYINRFTIIREKNLLKLNPS